MVKISDREKQIKREIVNLRNELEELRGESIVLCGYCYHIDEGNRLEHEKNSPDCYYKAYPCPLRVYKRAVSFNSDGKAIIDRELN